MSPRKPESPAKEKAEPKTPLLDCAELCSFVDGHLGRAGKYLKAFNRFGSPLYLIDREGLLKAADAFRVAFKKHFEDIRFYYAMKSNSHPSIVKTLVEAGMGVDVSSGQELSLALSLGPASIVFSGPGKTAEELELAYAHHNKVTVLVDSFTELERLKKVLPKSGGRLKIGVRLMLEEKGLWKKFGIPLDRLEEFAAQAVRVRGLDFCGLQFHASWNMDALRQAAFLKRLGAVLSGLDKATLEKIEFVDMGGGFWPEQGEWLQYAATEEGRRGRTSADGRIRPLTHYRIPALPAGGFAGKLKKAVAKYIFPYLKCAVFLEPGRWISHDAMHILLKVLDKKAQDVVITDGGTNMVGWERFEHDYFPVMNLTRPALDEKRCMIYGSLCTPHDIWGYSYFGEDIREGDILFIPSQGAYTYSLRQNFIKPLPAEVILPDQECLSPFPIL